MNDSGFDWIGETPSHWELIPSNKIFSSTRANLHDLLMIQNIGMTMENMVGSMEWCFVEPEVENVVKQTRDHLTTLGKSKSHALEPGELIISIAATVGVPSITDIKMLYTGTDLFIFQD